MPVKLVVTLEVSPSKVATTEQPFLSRYLGQSAELAGSDIRAEST
jgi:hypothetical protein